MAPYGYRIENGKAAIYKDEAEKVLKLFMHYISGMSLKDAAQKAGIERCHAAVARMIENRIYTGDEYYPQIIDIETFSRASEEKLKRVRKLGKEKKGVYNKEDCIKKFKFRIKNEEIPNQIKKDPFKHAEYIYSLIECEVEINECS